MSAQYVYNELSTPRSIRRLELLAGSQGEEIKCHLNEVDLDRCNPGSGLTYEALSYTWGDPSSLRGTNRALVATSPGSLRSSSITCDGKLIAVSPNLHDALIQLRYATSSRFVWADQICIDHDNLSELSQQVDLMYDLYSKAQQVLVWLGKADADSDQAMDFLLETITKLHSMEVDDARTYMQTLSQTHTAYRAPMMVAVYNLLTRAWFSRMWTIQEVARAEKAIVICGSKEIPFEVLELLNKNAQNDTQGMWSSFVTTITSAVIVDPKIRERSVLAHLQTASRLKSLGSSPQGNIKVPRFLQLTRTCDVSRESDRIYAMYRFFPNLRQRIGSPEYQKYTASELFHRLAKIELVHYKDIDYLNACGPKNLNPLGPTWVVDWSQRENNHPFWLLSQVTEQETGKPLFTASLGGLVKVEMSERDQILTVNGKVMSSIKEVCAPFDFAQSSLTETESPSAIEKLIKRTNTVLRLHESRRQQIEQCMHMVHRNITNLKRVARTTACHQTLLANTIIQGQGNISGGVNVRISDADANKLFKDFYYCCRYLPLRKLNVLILSVLTKELRAHEQAPASKSGITASLRSLWAFIITLTLTAFSLCLTITALNVVLVVAWAFSKTDSKKMLDAFTGACRGRTFFVTDDQQMGLGPPHMRAGDEVCVFYGCAAPSIIRRVGTRHELIGECYLHGFMDGEAVALDEVPEVQIKLQ